jgi:SAM-dependent methyltransferase
MVDVIGGQTFERTEHVACPICGSTPTPRRIQLRSELVAMVAECRACHVAFQTPRPSEAASAAYMQHRWRGDDSYVADADAQTKRATKQLKALADLTPTTLLDVGAGAGAFVAAARTAGWDAVGVEQSPAAIAQAKALHHITLHATIPNQTFDVITLWDVVEHLRDPEGLLRLLRIHLKPGGRLIVETGNYESWLRLLQRDAWGLYLFDHQYYFTPQSLAVLIERAGFQQFSVLRAQCVRQPRLKYAKRLGANPVTMLARWAEAKLRWPSHGDINVMIASAQAQ